MAVEKSGELRWWRRVESGCGRGGGEEWRVEVVMWNSGECRWW